MILKAIHEIIADATIADAVALVALLPAASICTGENHNRDLPYASVNLESNQSEYRGNTGGVRRPMVRFQVWHDSHAGGSAIAAAIEALFENKTFTTTDAKLKLTRHENTAELQEPDGTWQFLIDITTQAINI